MEHHVAAEQLHGLPFADVWMNFSGPIEGRARVDVPDWSRTNMALERHDLRLHDARPLVASLSLDREGFTLVHHESGLTPASNLAGVGPAYLEFVGALIRQVSGADLVLPQGKGLLMRHSERAERKGVIGPSRWVHMDYTTEAAHRWVEWIEGWQGMTLRGYPRFAIFQTWRCVTPPPYDNTLTLCDASSIEASDCIVFDACLAKPYEMPGNQFESQFCRFNPAQRWYFFLDLTPDEVIIFKGFDSDPAKFAQPLHNSIDLPDAPANAVPRVSVEARFFAFFSSP